MYLRTKEGLGEDQESWIAPQALNRVMAEPVPIGYLGNFNEYFGRPPKQVCYTVENFKPNSWLRTKDIQLYLDKIAKNIVRSIERKLRKLRLKRGQEAVANLYMEFRGHMDKKTDTGPKNLDERRLKEVHEDLDSRIKADLKTQNIHDRFNFSYFMNFSYSHEKSAHPVSSTIPGKNRRVEVCILGLRVTKV
jgi:hypothetical protein